MSCSTRLDLRGHDAQRLTVQPTVSGVERSAEVEHIVWMRPSMASMMDKADAVCIRPCRCRLFVHGAVGFHALVAFQPSLAGPELGGAGVAGAGVDLVEPDHDNSGTPLWD